MFRVASAYWLSGQVFGQRLIWTYKIPPCRHKLCLSSAQMPHMLFRTQDNKSMCVCGLDLRYHILQHPGMSLHVRMSSSSCLRAATASVA